MKLLVNREHQLLLCVLTALFGIFSALAMGISHVTGEPLPLWLLPLVLLLWAAALSICLWYLARQQKHMEAAVSCISAWMDGKTDVRIDCDEEGELYRLFHAVNGLAAILNAQAGREQQEKEFLKHTISDISHQLKTPLAALNIYNGLLKGEADGSSSMEEYVSLSEQELDRMEILVQNLLKITKLDAGTLIFEKSVENLSELMRDVELLFAYRARQEGKSILLSGSDTVSFPCDRDWLMEAIGNLVKNALDHTGQGACIRICWEAFPSAVQITVEDNGSGIHPEDLHHVFKRFYRSRFSNDTKGIGLGLSLTKAIVEAHNGTVEVSSTLGAGTVFTLHFIVR